MVLSFETFHFGPDWLLQLAIAHVVWKFPEAVMEESQPDCVSLLQQEIANCAFKTQDIKKELNRLSSPKTKEQLDRYNKCVEEMEKARKVYQDKVQEFGDLQTDLL